MPGFGAAAYVPAITLERALYVRERHDGLYTPLTYLLCKFIEEFLVVLPSSLLVSAIVFYALNLAGSFAIFWLTYLFALLTGIVLAYFVASASPNMDVANAALPAYVVSGIPGQAGFCHGCIGWGKAEPQQYVMHVETSCTAHDSPESHDAITRVLWCALLVHNRSPFSSTTHPLAVVVARR